MILLSVPPVDGLVVSPGLLPMIRPEYFAVNYVMFDVGKNIAKQNSISSKIVFAYRFYSSVIDRMDSDYAVGGKALVVIPDDFDLKTHIKLAEKWLESTERYALSRKLRSLGYEMIDVLIIRRVIKDLITMSVDLSPFMDFIKVYGDSIAYGVPANESTALVNTNVRCRFYPNQCVTHAKLIINELISHGSFWIHLLGPTMPVLRQFMNDRNVTSVDTTGHTYGSIHSNNGLGKINEIAVLMKLKNKLMGD